MKCKKTEEYMMPYYSEDFCHSNESKIQKLMEFWEMFQIKKNLALEIFILKIYFKQ